MGESLEVWVSDKLYDILGLSDKYVPQFLISLASKSSSPSDLVEKIRKTDTIEVEDKIIAFAQELWDRVSGPSC